MAWGSARQHYRNLAKAGRPIPQGFAEEPEIEVHNLFVWDAFWELSSERHLGMGIGPIPYRAVRAYARDNGVEGDEFDHFRAVIRSLDGEYLAKQTPKQTDAKVRDTVPIDDVDGVSGLLKRLAKPAPE